MDSYQNLEKIRVQWFVRFKNTTPKPLIPI